MLLTDAFLAKKAEFVEGGLEVRGGILGTLFVPPPLREGQAPARVGRLDLVSLLRTGPSDHQKPYRLTIDFVDAEGNKLHVLEDTIVFHDPAEGGGCWVSPMTLGNIKPGQVAFIVNVEGAGKPVRIPVGVYLKQ
ncbi:MAG: hypothetical protein K0U84_20530 [Actinomycetia bacterium]|nr:hypothetical protein [Actinomycetes bacterium]